MDDASIALQPKIQSCMQALGLSYCSHLGNQVYRVISPGYGQVAIKFAVSTRAKHQLQKETHFLAQHQSSYWPTYRENGGYQQLDWLMYSYVKGRSLAKQNAQQPITLALIEQLESGLKSIHNTGYIHADLKPANIVITPNGNPTLLDLGSVLPLGEEYGQLPYSSITPSFACINALVRQGRVSKRDDYVSLAITLQTLSGHHPYRGSSVVHLASNQQQPQLGAIPTRYQMILAQQAHQAKQLSV